MEPENKPEIESLLHQALELPPGEREDFLAEVCGGDAALRQEIESLIRADGEAGDFMARPILAQRADPPLTSPQRAPLVLERLLDPAGALPDPADGTRFPPGTVLAGRYRVAGLIGRGGMGEVYRADDLKLGETVALKFLPAPLAEDEAMLARFLREVKIARRIAHPNVCRVYDVGEVDGQPFLSMEYIDGEDLASRLRRAGRPAVEEAIGLARQLCRGLAAVHEEGILHRDLKPANVMIDGRGRARITDFGLAGLAGSISGAEARHGTPAYMAPEQHAGEGVSVQTDLYALGLTLYELLTGQRAFEADSAAELARLHREMPPKPPSGLEADLDPAVERIVLRCLEKDPRDRPSSVREVAAVLSGLPVPATTASLHQLPPPPADFTGREAELVELREAVKSGGVTISGLQGMGGVGKTALALKLAEELAPRYPDAQIYLDLKGASPQPLSWGQAMTHVIRAFRPEAPLPQTEAQLAGLYRSLLHGRRALLLMDNAAGREQVEPLIPPQGCALLVTSRRSFALPGLILKNLDVLPPEDAVTLLRCIVSRIGGEAEEIAGLCGYLPIALRLAGSTLAERRDLDPAEYARRLAEGKGRLDLVEASLTLSYELLSAEQQKLWRALGVFPGTFDSAAATAIWDLEPDLAAEVLGDLVRSSLVEWTDGRYRLHDLARLFAGHDLPEVEKVGLRRRHAEHYLGVLEQAEALYLRGGEWVRSGLRLLDTEWTNIHAGQAWAQTYAAEDQTTARLCSDYPQAGFQCLWLRLPAQTRVAWQEAALAATRDLGDRFAQGSHLLHLGVACIYLGELQCAIERHQQGLAVAREIGDQHSEGLHLGGLGTACHLSGDVRHAVECYKKALAVAQDIGNRRLEVSSLGSLGTAYRDLGESHRAIELHEQALAIARETGHRLGECQNLGCLGWLCANLDQPHRAVELMQHSLRIAREIGHQRVESAVLSDLGRTYVASGEPQRAIEFCEQGLAIAREIGCRPYEVLNLFALGQAHAALKKPPRAIEFLEQALNISREIGYQELESSSSWELGLLHEKRGDLARATELMQVRVDYERAIGHAEAEAHAASIDEIRARLSATAGSA